MKKGLLVVFARTEGRIILCGVVASAAVSFGLWGLAGPLAGVGVTVGFWVGILTIMRAVDAQDRRMEREASRKHQSRSTE